MAPITNQEATVSLEELWIQTGREAEALLKAGEALGVEVLKGECLVYTMRPETT
jgi:hypothetical protein